MSKVTDGFEKRRWRADAFTADTLVYGQNDVDELLAHTRALEAMLKDLSEKALSEYPWCLICGNGVYMGNHGHSPNCELAKLLE